MQKAADSERSMQLMMRSMTNGVISERDRLFSYTVGEFYQELSLFIQETETRNAEYKKLNKTL